MDKSHLFVSLGKQNNRFEETVRKWKGAAGEFDFVNHIECIRTIPGYYKVINSVLLPYGSVKTEIDIVFIHSKTIMCIEFKNLSGWIFGNEDQRNWTQTFKNGDKYHFYNPILQNESHREALASLLRTEPDNIDSLVVFANKCTLKDVTSRRVTVIKSGEFEQYINSFLQSREDRFTEKNINAVYELLKMYVPSRREMNEHRDRVKKYREGNQCPSCSRQLELKNRKCSDGKTLYYFQCMDCGFNREATFLEVMEFGTEEDKIWAWKNLIK